MVYPASFEQSSGPWGFLFVVGFFMVFFLNQHILMNGAVI